MDDQNNDELIMLMPYVPDEIWLSILYYLDLESLLVIRLCSKTLKNISSDIKLTISDYVVSGGLLKIFPLLSADLSWHNDIISYPNMILKLVINANNKFIPKIKDFWGSNQYIESSDCSINLYNNSEEYMKDTQCSVEAIDPKHYMKDTQYSVEAIDPKHYTLNDIIPINWTDDYLRLMTLPLSVGVTGATGVTGPIAPIPFHGYAAQLPIVDHGLTGATGSTGVSGLVGPFINNTKWDWDDKFLKWLSKEIHATNPTIIIRNDLSFNYQYLVIHNKILYYPLKYDNYGEILTIFSGENIYHDYDGKLKEFETQFNFNKIKFNCQNEKSKGFFFN